jgi:hypothetical protein
MSSFLYPVATPVNASVGSAGGIALDMQGDVTIQDLEVFGGGGGGGGSGSVYPGNPELTAGAGGGPGTAGAAGENGPFFNGAAGGGAGAAIARNGHTLTQVGTNTIQGAIT